VVDVRDDLRQGREPFQRIMMTANSLRPDQDMELCALFEPKPLFAVRAGMGFEHEAEGRPTAIGACVSSGSPLPWPEPRHEPTRRRHCHTFGPARSAGDCSSAVRFGADYLAPASLSLPLRYMVSGLVFTVLAFGFALANAP